MLRGLGWAQFKAFGCLLWVKLFQVAQKAGRRQDDENQMKYSGRQHLVKC